MKLKRILALLLVLMVPMTVCATEGQPEQTEYTTQQIEQIEEVGVVKNEITLNSIIDENVTIDVVEDKILTKLYEVAGLLQKIAAPISIITFIIGAIIMVTGALGKKDGARTGIIVCVLSIVMYAVCMYSEPIIVAVANWMAS